jgi:hypothetical protein
LRRQPQCGQLAKGQRLLIAAVALNYGGAYAGAQWMAENPAAMVLFGLVAISLFVLGMVDIGKGFRWSPLRIFLSLLLMLVPLVNLIALWRLNSKVTDTLRGAGYHVGLFGASS